MKKFLFIFLSSISVLAQRDPVATVPTVADMVALRITPVSSNLLINVLGYNTPNDGGGGLFMFTTNTASTTNGGTIFSGGSGRFLRQLNGQPVTPKMFGARADGVTDDTTAFQSTVTYASTAGIPVYLPAGSYVINSTLTLPTTTNRFAMQGAGREVTRILTDVNGASAFNFIGVFVSLSDFTVTGTATSGHCFRFVDPAYESGAYLPQQVSLNRVYISGFTGNDVDHLGNAMPAAGLFAVNALQLTAFDCFFGSNNIGAYVYATYTPNFTRCVFYASTYGGVVDQNSEGTTVNSCDFVGYTSTNSWNLVAASAIDGSNTINSAQYICVDSRGSVLRDSKLKNGWSQIILKSVYEPQVVANFIVPDIKYGILSYAPATIIGNTFYPFYLTTGNRKHIYFPLPAARAAYFGQIKANRFDYGGGGNLDAFIHIDAPDSSYSASGVITDNLFGGFSGTANTNVYINGIYITGYSDSIAINHNKFLVPSNVTITNAINLPTSTFENGPSLRFNSFQTLGGTIENETLYPGTGNPVVAEHEGTFNHNGWWFGYADYGHGTNVNYLINTNWASQTPQGWERRGTNWIPVGIKNTITNAILVGYQGGLGASTNFTWDGSLFTLHNTAIWLDHDKFINSYNSSGSPATMIGISPTNTMLLGNPSIPIVPLESLNMATGKGIKIPVLSNVVLRAASDGTITNALLSGGLSFDGTNIALNVTNYTALTFAQPGVALTVSTNTQFYVIPAISTLKTVSAHVLVPSSSGSVTFDLLKNGTTVLSTPVTISAGATNATATLSVTALAAGDRLTPTCTAAGTDTEGAQFLIGYTRP